MVNNNIPRISTIEFATSFGMDNRLIKKSYFYSILLITLSFFIAFPSGKLLTGTGGDPPPPPPPFPRPQPPVLPNHHIIFVNVHTPVIPDPTPFEPEVNSAYIFDQDVSENNVMFEGDWLFQPDERPGIGAVKVAKPVCNEKVLPFYPELARKAGIPGVVIVRIVIGVDGTVTNADIVSSPGRQFGFDDAALNAVRQWKCEPAMINDRKVETESVVTVNFRMER